ncbi:hypothetical protein [Sphingomonas quercus]|uniref:Uncharacterized protein n=1 Tax=Sphingomonas quercus TaxID=2842451 RepID=A0ABS6BHN9_9SPHN|nr:hypothetical protein [Sphingomonas quercus]MBU3077818.1 hypothetical protein [Sphingomonas quercus]
MQSEIPAILDPWVASSLLQKAIRRGEVEHAVRAAQALHRQRGTGIWGRFLIIACEDVGIADLDLVQHVTLVGIDRTVRKPFGTDEEVAADLARRLAEAPKDRSSDYLACAAIQHPEYEQERESVALLSTDEQIAAAVDRGQSVIRRAIATWHASGVNSGGPRVVRPSNLPLLLHGFDLLGLPHPLSSIIETAARKSREPMVVMLPLLWALWREGDEERRSADVSVPAALSCRGVPLWTFDKHTRLGKRAIARFIHENVAVDAVLSEHVPDFRARDIAAMAAFYADATPIARRLVWSRSHELEALGLETDMLKIGCPRAGIEPLVEVVRANLDHLNVIRHRLFAAQANGGSAA